MGKSGAVLESASSIARPVLKGRHQTFMKKHLAIGISYAVACVIFTKLLVNEPRKRAYAEYYKWVASFLFVLDEGQIFDVIFIHLGFLYMHFLIYSNLFEFLSGNTTLKQISSVFVNLATSNRAQLIECSIEMWILFLV